MNISNPRIQLAFALLCTAIFTLFAGKADAQILNIERHRLKSDTVRFLMNARFGLNINNRSAAEDSPVNLFGVNSAANAIYKGDKHGYIFVGQTDYLAINDSEFLNFGFAHFRVNFFRDRKLNYEAFTQASYDNFRGLDPRILGGVGIRLRVVETEKSELILGLGGFYENERWQHPDNESTVEAEFVKVSAYASVRKDFNENLTFNAVLYYQGGYDAGIEDVRHRVSGNVNFNTKITKRLALNNSFEFGYEDKPIVPITKFIYALRTGVLISL